MKHTFTLVLLVALLLAIGGMLLLYQTIGHRSVAPAPTLISTPAPTPMPQAPIVPPQVTLPTPVPIQNPALPVKILTARMNGTSKPVQPHVLRDPAPALAAPAPAIEWVIKDERQFDEKNCSKEKLQPWYESRNAGIIRESSAAAPGAQADPHGTPLLALDGTDKQSQFLHLTPRAPHDIRWTVQVRTPAWGHKVFQYSETGLRLVTPPDPNAAFLDNDRDYTVTIERSGQQLQFRLNGGPAQTYTVAGEDRGVIELVSVRPDSVLQLRNSRLEFAKGAELSDPPPPAPAAIGADIQWVTAYKDTFDDPNCFKKYLQVDGGELAWSEKYKALFFKNGLQGTTQIYAAIHQSLPGDLRVRMRVLRRKDADEINIALLFNLKGALKAEEGYFAEFKQGEVQIKRLDQQMATAPAPTPQPKADTDDRWVTIELRKVGGTIALFMQDKKVLEWTDPHPFTDAQHDLASFYVWDERTLIDDLVIDRNPQDPVKPLADDPATDANAVNGTRTPNDPTPDQF